MKKRTAFLLTFILALSLIFSGCSKKAAEKQEEVNNVPRDPDKVVAYTDGNPVTKQEYL
jgi:PBP1b-binding outer membrane lipoprotein LpoB